MSNDNFVSKIIEFKNSKEWIEFKNYYNASSVVEQLGLFNEDTNTNFLKSILDDSNTKVYNFSEEPMKLFLEMLSIRAAVDGKNIDYIKILKPYDIDDLHISLRDSSLFGRNIPDMVIEFTIDNQNYIIILEAKTFSKEHGKQCTEYYNAIRDNEKYSHKIFVYLTIDGSKSSMDDVYINITYQDLINYVYKPLLYGNSNKTPLSLEEYIKTFNEYYYIGNNLIITPVGETLTFNIWNKWKDLFEQIFTNQELLNYFSDFKSSEEQLVDILFMNLSSLKVKYQWNSATIENISNYVNNTKVNLRVGGHKVFRNRFNYEVLKLLENEDVSELDLTINEGLRYKYFYSEKEYIKMKSNRQWYSNDYYGELKFDGENYYYMCALNNKDAKDLCDRIRKSKYKNKVNIEVDYNLKLNGKEV